MNERGRRWNEYPADDLAEFIGDHVRDMIEGRDRLIRDLEAENERLKSELLRDVMEEV